MNLVTMMVMALLAPLALFGAQRAFKMPPTTRNRGIGVLLLFTGYAFGLSVTLLLPSTLIRDIQGQIARDRLRSDARLAEAREMIDVLGSPQTYIEYLKATKGE